MRRFTGIRRQSRRPALTLLEVVLSLSILLVLSSTTFWFYSSAMQTRQRDTNEASKVRLARVLLDRLAAEIRQVAIKTNDLGVGIVGEKEAIEISSLRLPSRELAEMRFDRTELPSPEYDLVKITYRIARHPDILDPEGDYEFPLGLARVETRIPRAEAPVFANNADESVLTTDEDGKIGVDENLLNSMLGGIGEGNGDGGSLETDVNWEELYSQEIRYLRFCYYDGASWWDDWHVSGENPLPQLVLVTIGFEAHPACGEEPGRDEDNEKFCECLNRDPPDCKPLPPDQFSTIVRVTPSDPLFRSRVAREGQALVEKATQSENGNDNGQAGEQP